MNLDALARKIAAAGLPALGGALAGPAGAAVASTVAATLGVDAEPDAIAKAVVTDPDAMIALRGLEAETNRERMAHEERLAAAQIADVQHAREHAPDDTVRRWLAVLLPLTAVLFGAGFAAVLVLKGQVTEAIGIAGMIIGWLIADARAATSFYFGTSIGSAKKQATIDREIGGLR